ncbi:MAG: EamA family transporter [Saprospiraceae bacterium]|nr:EamA family transporter [Saprospiraceae bacterium]
MLGSWYCLEQKLFIPCVSLITAGFHMVFGGIPVAVLSFCLESWKSVHVGPDLVFIWLYLIFFGSIVAYSAYIYALKHLPATIVSIQSYINPIIALILGAVILHEPHNFKIITGAAITLLGVLIINYSYIRSKRKKANISFVE